MNLEFALRAVRQIIIYLTLTCDSKVISVSLIFVVIYTPQATIVSNMNTLSQNIKEEFVLQAISQIDF